MSIEKIYRINVSSGNSVVSSPVFLYENDKNVDLTFSIFDFEYLTKAGGDIIKALNPSNCSVSIEYPNGDIINNSTNTKIQNNYIVFNITKELTSYVGNYKLYFHLYDIEGSRATIPPINFEIRKLGIDEEYTGPTGVLCTSVYLNQSSLLFNEFEAKEIIATVVPSNTTETLIWETSDANVATVTNGVVTPIKNGSCTITATCGKHSAYCNVTVDVYTGPTDVLCTSVHLNQSSLLFNEFEAKEIIATVVPSNTTETLIWETSNANVATVTNGVVTPIKNGSCTITATCGKHSAYCNVTVDVSSIEEVPPAEDETPPGDNVDIEIKLEPEGFAIGGGLDGNKTFRHTVTYIKLSGNEERKICWDLMGWMAYVVYDENYNVITFHNPGFQGTEYAIANILEKYPNASYVRVSVNKPITTVYLSKDDNEKFGNIILNQTSLSIDEKGTGVFTVCLDSKPTNSQNILLSLDNNNCSISKKNLTFTPDNYNTPQSITVTGVHHENNYSNLASTITLSSNYVSSKTVNVTIKNIDMNINVSGFSYDENSPYISNGYIEQEIAEGEALTFDVSVGDYNDTLWRNDDTSITFDIYYNIDGKTYSKKGVKAGDYTITLPVLSVGEYELTLFTVDSTNRISHKLYIDFKVRALSETETVKEVTTTELANYGVNYNGDNTSSVMTSTLNGLQKLINNSKSNGYTYLKLPANCIFRVPNDSPSSNATVNHPSSIKIPSDFTLDLNGSTIIQNTYVGDYGVVIEFTGVKNAHIKNGTLQGDYGTRVLSTPTTGEHSGLLMVNNDAKYCTIENMTIKDSVGYTIHTSGYGVNGSNVTLSNFTSIDINSNGDIISSSSVYTSDYADISSIVNYGKAMIGKFLGWRGQTGNCYFCKAHFYDSSYNFISTEFGWQYRFIKIPSNAKYVRVSVYSTTGSDIGSVCIYNPPTPTNIKFKNIAFENTRTCAIAFQNMNNVIVEDCTFYSCGHSITPAAIDLEDGWEQMQDCTFKGCEVIKKAGTMDGIFCAGFNIRMVNCINMYIGFQQKVFGAIVKGGTPNSIVIDTNKARVFDTTIVTAETITSGVRGSASGNSSTVIVVKDSTFSGVCQYAAPTYGTVIAKNCVFDRLSINPSSITWDIYNAKLYNCTIKNYLSNSGVQLVDFIDCTFENNTFFGYKNKNTFTNCIDKNTTWNS